VRPEPAGFFVQVLCHLPPLSFEAVLLLRKLFVCHQFDHTLHVVQERLHTFFQVHGAMFALHDDAQTCVVITGRAPRARRDNITELLFRAENVEGRLGQYLGEQRSCDPQATVDLGSIVDIVRQSRVGLIGIGHRR
jgi:hypothetical protein